MKEEFLFIVHTAILLMVGVAVMLVISAPLIWFSWWWFKWWVM